MRELTGDPVLKLDDIGLPLVNEALEALGEAGRGPFGGPRRDPTEQGRPDTDPIREAPQEGAADRRNLNLDDVVGQRPDLVVQGGSSPDRRTATATV